MPLIRKIVAFGKSSKGIILPKSWLDFLEQKHGKIKLVAMEVNGNLIITPIIGEEKMVADSQGIYPRTSPFLPDQQDTGLPRACRSNTGRPFRL